METWQDVDRTSTTQLSHWTYWWIWQHFIYCLSFPFMRWRWWLIECLRNFYLIKIKTGWPVSLNSIKEIWKTKKLYYANVIYGKYCWDYPSGLPLFFWWFRHFTDHCGLQKDGDQRAKIVTEKVAFRKCVSKKHCQLI